MGISLISNGIYNPRAEPTSRLVAALEAICIYRTLSVTGMPRSWDAGSSLPGECAVADSRRSMHSEVEALFHGTRTPPRLEYTLDRPVGGEQPRCERESCSWKPNCGLPSTPIRGWTVKGSRVPPLTFGRGIDGIPPLYSRRGGGQTSHGRCSNVAGTPCFRVLRRKAFTRWKHLWQLYHVSWTLSAQSLGSDADTTGSTCPVSTQFVCSMTLV